MADHLQYDDRDMADEASPDGINRLYIKRSTGKVFGPFDLQAIRLMLEAGKISAEARASADRQDWKHLDEFAQLADLAGDTDLPEAPSLATGRLGGWASSVVEDKEDADLPRAHPPNLPAAREPSSNLPGALQPDGSPNGPDPSGASSDGPSLPKPKSKGDAPPLPKPSSKRGGASSATSEPSGNKFSLPKPKTERAPLPGSRDGDADLPASKSAELPRSGEQNDDLPAAKGQPDLPQTKHADLDLPANWSGDDLPQSKEPDSLPQSRASDSLPQSKGPDSLPQSRASDSLPQAKGDDALPGLEDEGFENDDDLFGPVDDEHDDLVRPPGSPLQKDGGRAKDREVRRESDDLFAPPDDADDDDLFGRPDGDDIGGGPAEDDLFEPPTGSNRGSAAPPKDDLFSPPGDEHEDDLFGSLDGDGAVDDGPRGNSSFDEADAHARSGSESEGADLSGEGDDLFAAPDDDDDDLFAAPDDDDDDLFAAEGGRDSARNETGNDDFLSGEESFSFLDDSPPEPDSDTHKDDLAGKSGEWGNDLMDGGPADPSFDTGRYDDEGSTDEDAWDDEFVDDGYDNQAVDDDDPLLPASPGPRQPASAGPETGPSPGKSAQTTRDEAVDEDKKRGLMTMVGVPLLGVLVLGGAAYGLYRTYFEGSPVAVAPQTHESTPSTIELKAVRSDNYADLRAAIDKASQHDVDGDQRPKLVLAESLLLSRYDAPEVADQLAELAEAYVDASDGWKALARGAFEAQNASADAARSYLEPLGGADGPIRYYAHLMMGIGDALALEKTLADSASQPTPPDDPGSSEQPKDKPAGQQQVDRAAAPDHADGTDEDDTSTESPTAQRSQTAADRSGQAAPLDEAAQRLAERAQTALETAAKARPKAPAAHYWLGHLAELRGDHSAAIEAWSRGLKSSPDHVASQVAIGTSFYKRGKLNKATDHLQKVLDSLEALASTTEKARAYHLIGRIHSARQQRKQAIAALTEALKLDPGRADTVQALAEEYMAAQKYQKALTFFTTNKKLGEENPDVMLAIIRAEIGLQKWDDAIKKLQKGEKLFPNDARFPLYLGRLNRERAAFFDAQKSLKRAVDIDPALLSAHAALAQLAWQTDQDIEAAEAHVQQIQSRSAQIDESVATEVARYYQMSDRGPRAEKWYKLALERDPNYWPARLALARMYLDEDQTNQALTLLERAQEQGVEDPHLAAYLADAYRQSEHFAKAIEQINSVIDQVPNNKDYIFIKGRIYFDQGNFDNARRNFNKAYELDPQYQKAYFFVGRTIFEQGDFKKAIKIFRHVLDYQPNDGDFRYWMGRAYEAQGRLTQALEEYRNATELDNNYGPSHPQLFVRRGRLLSRIGHTGQSRKDITHALELAPNMTAALVAMGELNYETQDYEKAVENFKGVIAASPDHPTVQYKLGMSLMHSGQELDAAKYLQNSVRFGYKDPDVLKTLGYLYKRMHRNQLAVKSFKSYLSRVGDGDGVPVATKREMLDQIERLGGHL